MALFNYMKRQVKSKYDSFMRMNNGPKKNDELKKFMKQFTHLQLLGKRKMKALFLQGKGS